MSRKDILSYFGPDLCTLHLDDLYFVLSVLLPEGTNIDRFVSKILNEKAKI